MSRQELSLLTRSPDASCSNSMTGGAKEHRANDVTAAACPGGQWLDVIHCRRSESWWSARTVFECLVFVPQSSPGRGDKLHKCMLGTGKNNKSLFGLEVERRSVLKEHPAGLQSPGQSGTTSPIGCPRLNGQQSCSGVIVFI